MRRIQTNHGIITIWKEETGINNRYYKECTRQHYFIKYDGFAISQTELEIMKDNNVEDIIIKYIGTNKNLLLKSNIEQWLQAQKYLNEENNKQDWQRVLPQREMQLIGIETNED